MHPRLTKGKPMHTLPSLGELYMRLRLVIGVIFLCVSHLALAQTLGFSTSEDGSQNQVPGQVRVVVRDDLTLQPINDARVSVEESRAKIFTITASKPGYATTTVVGVTSPMLQIFLKPIAPDAHEAIARGEMTRWNPTDDSQVQAGFVFRSLTASDLLHFQSSSFISPLRDTIDVMGPQEIPSNVTIPDQEIPIFLGSIRVNKPIYRLPVPRAQESRLVGIQGEIPVSELIAVATGGGNMSFELLNKLQFTRVGIGKPTTPLNDFNQDIDPAYALTKQHQVITARSPFDADVLAVAVTDLQGDRSVLLPTDIKLASKSGETPRPKGISLSSTRDPVGSSRLVLTVASADNGRRISGIVSDQAGKTVRTGEFLSVSALTDVPSLPAAVDLKAPSQGITVAVFNAGQPIWYVYTLPAAGSVRLPTDRLAQRDSIKRFSRVELEFSPGFNERQLDGQTALKTLTRFGTAVSRINPQDY